MQLLLSNWLVEILKISHWTATMFCFTCTSLLDFLDLLSFRCNIPCVFFCIYLVLSAPHPLLCILVNYYHINKRKQNFKIFKTPLTQVLWISRYSILSLRSSVSMWSWSIVWLCWLHAMNTFVMEKSQFKRDFFLLLIH